MIVRLLMIDNQPAGDDFIDDPSWEDIEDALHKMEGRYRTYLGLYKAEEPTEEDFLMIGGGQDRNKYVCSYYNGGVDYYVLNQQETMPNVVMDIPIGQMNAKKKKYVNVLNDIIGAVKYFYETGNMSPHVLWEAV